MEKKSIEFRFRDDENVSNVVNMLVSVLNIEYHHHYIKTTGIGVLEYFEIK